MDRISSYALALALLLASPVLADDVWDLPDAVSKTVTGERAAPEDDAGAAEDAEEAAQPSLHDQGREEAEVPAGQPGFREVRDHTQDEGGSASADQPRQAPARDERTSNVLGPLWGTPQDAPVMKNIDPELEKQYAKDSQGRLVPRSEMSKEDQERLRQQEREQAAAEREAQFERDRQERAAKAEAKRLEREAQAAQREQEREAREAQRQRERADEGEAAPAEEPADEAEDEASAPSGDATTRPAHYDHKVGGRSTPESEGW